MQTVFVFGLQLFYIISLIGLALYGLQAFWLTVEFLYAQTRHHSSHALPPHAELAGDRVWPRVTVQLPIYNEHHVVERLINACANLAYPAAKLQIQILDDSDDQTTAVAARLVEQWRQRGRAIELIRRPDRSGFKAGALAHALPLATGEYIAIFDADFVPPADFLQRLIPTFFAPTPPQSKSQSDGEIGFVQARWGHLNGAYSALTRCQTLALDGHFVVEQGGRQAAGFAFGFNGSGGVWRRACIEAATVGGWQADTLCEDLDLSYRAQLAGWRPSYRNDIEAPAEVPPQLIAFKRQQFRWAKGSIQTLKKLGGRVWQSEWPLRKRLAALVHLGSYLLHPLLLLLLFTSLPLIWLDATPGAYIAILSLASLGPPLLYAVGQQQLHRARWWQRWLHLPLLTLLGTGLCLSNTVAVYQGWTNRGGGFLRTPKFHVEDRRDGWRGSTYRLPIDGSFVGECLLLIYALCTVVVAWQQGSIMFALYLLLYVGGFALMVGLSLWQARPVGHPVHPRQQSVQGQQQSTPEVQRSGAS